MEIQRQCMDLAIASATPTLLGLFSPVTLMAHERWKSRDVWVRRAAWYDRILATFCTTAPGREMIQVPLESIERLADALCYAA